MFEHSIKVPRQYKLAANILKKVSTEGGSIKTLLYDIKLRHFRTNVLYALITESIKHAADIDKIFDSTSILKNEPRLDPWLAKILTTELLFGKKSLPGKSKPEQTILSYKEKFENFTAQHQGILKDEAVRRPRYVRINTNLLTTSDAIRAFQDEGYRFIRCTSGSYNDYLTQIKNLDQFDFTQDYHVKYVFVFAPGTKLHEHELYLENKIILQDKATTLAVYLLAPPPRSVVLDMCAAPGMKTSQMAAFMKNEGKIYAMERNEGRYKTLCDFVERTGSKCVETIHIDTLETKKGEYDDVEYILLDPSCTGSGMELCVHNYIDDTRLSKLTSLQEKFLKHAMNSFPKAKRIVYSTCSLFSEENERVVTNAVKTSRSKWRVQDVKELLKGQWNNFGSSMYGSIGARCIYARPNADLTTGFFLAVLDRDPKDLEKQINVTEKNETVSSVSDNPNSKYLFEDGKGNSNSKNKESSSMENERADNIKVLKKTNKPGKNKNIVHEIVKSEIVTQDNNTIQETFAIAKAEEQKLDEVVNKRKKKKKKGNDLDKVSESTNLDNNGFLEQLVSGNTDYDEGESLVKKKKSHRIDKDSKFIGEDGDIVKEIMSHNIEHYGEQCVTTKKKKKKRKYTEIDTKANQDFAPDKERKVEQQQYIDSLTQETDKIIQNTSDEQDLIISKHKKKKNLSKIRRIENAENVSIYEIDNDGAILADIPTHSPSKKKKKHNLSDL